MDNKKHTSYGPLFMSYIKLTRCLKRKMEGMGNEDAEKEEEEKAPEGQIISAFQNTYIERSMITEESRRELTSRASKFNRF